MFGLLNMGGFGAAFILFMLKPKSHQGKLHRHNFLIIFIGCDNFAHNKVITDLGTRLLSSMIWPLVCRVFFKLLFYSCESESSLEVKKHTTHRGRDGMKGHCVPQCCSVFLELKADFEPRRPLRETSRLAKPTQMKIMAEKDRGKHGKRLHGV